MRLLILLLVLFTCSCTTLKRWNDDAFREREHIMLEHERYHRYVIQEEN